MRPALKLNAIEQEHLQELAWLIAISPEGAVQK